MSKLVRRIIRKQRFHDAVLADAVAHQLRFPA
jgi:hypothetical protein